jgi:hypothetical protein
MGIRELAFHHHNVAQQRPDRADGLFQIEPRQRHGQLGFRPVTGGFFHQQTNFVGNNRINGHGRI